MGNLEQEITQQEPWADPRTVCIHPEPYEVILIDFPNGDSEGLLCCAYCGQDTGIAPTEQHYREYLDHLDSQIRQLSRYS